MDYYKGITTVRLCNSTVEVVCESRPWRPWCDFLPWVAVSHVEQDGEAEPSVQVEGNALTVKNASAVIQVPYSRKTSFEAREGSLLTGELSTGRVDSDDSSKVRIGVPFGYRRSLGPVPSTMFALLEDAVYMGLGFITLAAAGAAILRLFGGDPMKYIDVFAIVAAGVYVGIRGSAKRALLASMAVAAVCVFGPEFATAVTEGPSAGFGELGGEDVLKVIVWAATFSLGAAARRHYVSRTA